MDVQTRRAIRVDLSSESEFRLGPVLVIPSLRQIVCGKRQATLEPRVMQLLVVLSQPSGEVVSRDELILRCWDGLIVGDNAINRVVSLLRTAATDTCDGAFEIETIKKVGYRLVLRAGGAAPTRRPDAPPSLVTRRTWLIAGGGAALVLAGGGYLLRRQRPQPPRLARDLFDRGAIAQRQSLPDQTDQAIAFFNEAVKNAIAWSV